MFRHTMQYSHTNTPTDWQAKQLDAPSGMNLDLHEWPVFKSYTFNFNMFCERQHAQPLLISHDKRTKMVKKGTCECIPRCNYDYTSRPKCRSYTNRAAIAVSTQSKTCNTSSGKPTGTFTKKHNSIYRRGQQKDNGCVTACGGWQSQRRTASLWSLNSLSHASQLYQLAIAAKLTKGYSKTRQGKVRMTSL